MENDDRALIDGQTPKSALDLITIGQRARLIGRGRFGRKHPDVDGKGPLLASLLVARMHQQSLQPLLEAVWVTEGRQVAPRSHERRLDSVLSAVVVLENSASDGKQAVDRCGGKRSKGVAIASTGLLH